MRSTLRPVLKQVHQLWFQGLAASSRAPSEACMRRWWGAGRSKEDRLALDQHCTSQFAHVLESISKVPIKSRSDADKYAQSLMQESCEDEEGSVDQYGETLGLLLLLDQMSRHVYRDQEAKIVYSYFDKIAQAVAAKAIERQLDTVENKDAWPLRQWFCMPMMHSEDIHQQDLVLEKIKEVEALISHDEKAMVYLENSKTFSLKHRDIIKKFGRFPHRNECLQRESTEAEKTWLAQGGDDFSTA